MISGKNTPRFAQCGQKEFVFQSVSSPYQSTPINTLQELIKSPYTERSQKVTEYSAKIDSPLSYNNKLSHNKENTKRSTKIKALAEILPKRACGTREINLKVSANKTQYSEIKGNQSQVQRKTNHDQSKSRSHRGLEVSLTRKGQLSEVKKRSCSKKINLSIVQPNQQQPSEIKIRGLSPRVMIQKRQRANKSQQKQLQSKGKQEPQNTRIKKKIKLSKVR